MQLGEQWDMHSSKRVEGRRGKKTPKHPPKQMFDLVLTGTQYKTEEAEWGGRQHSSLIIIKSLLELKLLTKKDIKVFQTCLTEKLLCPCNLSPFTKKACSVLQQGMDKVVKYLHAFPFIF